MCLHTREYLWYSILKIFHKKRYHNNIKRISYFTGVLAHPWIYFMQNATQIIWFSRVCLHMHTREYRCYSILEIFHEKRYQNNHISRVCLHTREYLLWYSVLKHEVLYSLKRTTSHHGQGSWCEISLQRFLLVSQFWQPFFQKSQKCHSLICYLSKF